MDELEIISLDGFEILDTPLNIQILLDQSQLGHSTDKSNNNNYNDNNNDNNDKTAEDPYADLPDLIPFDDLIINNTNPNSPIELEYNSSQIVNDGGINLDELNRYIESTEDLKFVCLKLAELEQLITSKLNLLDTRIHY